MSMNWLSTLPALGCVLSTERRAYPLSAPLCCELTHTKRARAVRARTHRRKPSPFAICMPAERLQVSICPLGADFARYAEVCGVELRRLRKYDRLACAAFGGRES